MPAANVSLIRPDGLHLLARATLAQLAGEATLSNFAGGLVHQALTHIPPAQTANWTLAEALYQPDPQLKPLLTALLVLDAAVNAVIDGKSRDLPLPGFLSYRPSLPLARFPLNVLRLPPLNPDGQYLLTLADGNFCCALRLDMHPRLKVAGHVRLAVSSPTREPVRLRAVEHRLERQVLTLELVETAVRAGGEELATAEQERLREALDAIIWV